MLASLEFITKLANIPHILQHLNAAKYRNSEGICGEIPRFFAPWGKNGCLSRQGEARRGVAFSNATPRVKL